MSDQKQTHWAEVTTPGEREIRVERMFDAPRERVFELFMDPVAVAEWWGPRMFKTTIEAMDARSGGDWLHRVELPDGTRIAFGGVFQEVVSPERFVKTIERDGTSEGSAVETGTFEDLGDRTRLVTTSVYRSKEERDATLASGLEAGVNESYERFDELLARTAG